MLLGLFLSTSLTTALAGEPIPDVVRDLGAGTRVNWTQLRLEVTDGARDPTVGHDARPLEQRSIKAIEARLPAALALVPIRPGETAGSAGAIDANHAALGWRVAETRYFTSGRVEVVGAVELRDELAQWSTDRAVTRDEGAQPAGPTGVLIDARGLGLSPSYAPDVRDPDGKVLFDGTLWRHVSYASAPVVWVSDAAAPDAAAAGESPEMFVAASASGGAIVLTAADAARFHEKVEGTDAVRTGHVVVVVDAGP
jgi:hypothetical protein